MELEQTKVSTHTPELLGAEGVKCSRCARNLTSPQERIDSPRGTLCAPCYQKLMFPHTTLYSMELID